MKILTRIDILRHFRQLQPVQIVKIMRNVKILKILNILNILRSSFAVEELDTVNVERVFGQPPMELPLGG